MNQVWMKNDRFDVWQQLGDKAGCISTVLLSMCDGCAKKRGRYYAGNMMMHLGG
jgi:hypothetical protein